MCQVLNIIILGALYVELWKICDRLDEAKDRRTKIYLYARYVMAGVVTCIALGILYKAFGITSENLGNYLRGVI